MTLEPLGNNVLVEPCQPPEKIGSIIVATAYQQPDNQGIVVAVGPGKMDYAGRMIAPSIKPGDRVVANWIQGQSFNVNGKPMKLLDAEYVLGVIRA